MKSLDPERHVLQTWPNLSAMSSHVSNVYYSLQMLKQRWFSLGNYRQRIKLLRVEVEMHMAKELYKMKGTT